MRNFADCSAVIATFRKAAAGRDLKHFPCAGVFRGPGIPYVECILKVAAHVWEEDARRQGWHSDWVGNNLADEYAGRARPPLTVPPRPWILERRSRLKLLRELLSSLQPEELWHDMFSSRPATSRKRAVEEQDAEHHLPVFTGGGWTCRVCGQAARKHGGLAGGACAGRLLAAAAAHPTHDLHAACFGEIGSSLRLIFCTACGAHGCTKATS